MNAVVLRQAPAINYLLWNRFGFRGNAYKIRSTVFHSPIHFGLPQFTRSKCVLTLHDAIDELYYANARTKQREPVSQYLVRLISSMARFRADHILTVSEHSRRDLMEHFRIPAHKISAVHEAAADERFHAAISAAEIERVRAKYQLPQRFAFYVGSLEPRKNVPFLLRTLADAKLQNLYLVVGEGSAAEKEQVLRLSAALGFRDQVVTAGRIDDDDLPAFYAQAYTFLYPS